MSKTSDKKSQVMGSLAAVQTLLERYPTLTTTDSMLTNASVNTSVGFLIDILSLLGITQADLVNWISRLLSGNEEGDGGLLLVIEHAIKAVLMANLKDMWSCSVDPILPDSLMKYSNPNFPGGETRPDPCTTIPTSDKLYRKIEIDLNQVDMFGTLNNCPSDETGSVFYFDSYDSIYNIEGEAKPALSPNNLWKSCDFNAYLWYIINKGTLSNETDLQYSCWDNRNKYVKNFKDSPELKDEFFNIENCKTRESAELQSIPIIDSDGNEVNKQQIILCSFEERPTPTADEGSLPSSNMLRVWLNANRYYHTRKITTKNPKTQEDYTMYFNKTIFEFNYDYIYSLKLFDTKTMVSQIVNSLLGISASVSASFSVEQKMTEAKVAAIVSRVIETIDDDSNSDCYFTFTNDEYDALMREAKENYSGVYQTNGMEGVVSKIDSAAILDELKNLKQSDNLVEQRTSISRTIENIMTIAASDPTVTDEYKFSFGFNFIKDFLKQTVTQIVLQVLTPKVAILYQINGAIMGGEAANQKSWEDFLRNFQNVLINIIRQVKDIIVEELYKFVMDQIKPLISLVISKIALETVRYYKDLIEQLIKDCIPNFSLPNFSTNTSIDNVDYADITTEATPENIDDKNC